MALSNLGNQLNAPATQPAPAQPAAPAQAQPQQQYAPPAGVPAPGQDPRLMFLGGFDKEEAPSGGGVRRQRFERGTYIVRIDKAEFIAQTKVKKKTLVAVEQLVIGHLTPGSLTPPGSEISHSWLGSSLSFARDVKTFAYNLEAPQDVDFAGYNEQRALALIDNPDLPGTFAEVEVWISESSQWTNAVYKRVVPAAEVREKGDPAVISQFIGDDNLAARIAAEAGQ